MPEKGGAGIMRYLTFALTKGRLANKTLDMFEKIGIHVRRCVTRIPVN